MTITKTKNGTYRLRVYIPEEAKKSLGIDKKLIEKRFKLRSDAKKYELELQNKIDNVLNGSFQNIHDTGDILFSEFYKNIWWNSYKSGQTTTTNKPPSKVTIDNTEIVFRLHILPLLGNYSINFLNQNKQVVLNLLTKKAEEYANFKVIRSYVNSIFDWAEELEYIEANRVSKTIKRIKATKKIMLQESKEDSDLFLSQKELLEWFKAFEEDLL
ncbi:TPA: site-specific integrase, partial [Streptococcus agalactiae]|nr:site-specific integrase [Streptococcus agalactiae]